MNLLKRLFKRTPKADDEQIEAEIAEAETVLELSDIEVKPAGRVHTKVKRPSWSLEKSQGGGVRKAMPKSLRKMKENASE